jgi:hypothetical protein
MRTTLANTFDHSLELMQTALTLTQRARTLRRRFPPSIQGASDGATQEERLSALLEAGNPDTYCFTCLGIALELPESRVRDIAQLLVLQDGSHVVEHRKCFHCGRAEPMVVLERAA